MTIHIKLAYNISKSLLISKYIQPKQKILCLGCNNGSDVLKYKIYAPECVLFIDRTQESIQKLIDFVKEKQIKYSICTLKLNFNVEEWTYNSIQIPQISNLYDFQSFDITTTFFSLEHCRTINEIQHICHQIYSSLVPGGIWLGCMIDGGKVINEINETGIYNDNYCTIQMAGDHRSYTFTAHGKPPARYCMLTLTWLEDMAINAGLELIEDKSIFDLIGETDLTNANTRTLLTLNKNCSLKLADIRSLSLIRMFVIRKPLS
jgi:hypothetical protein